MSEAILVTCFKRVKLRLQFTGYLQYIPTTIVMLILFLIAGATWLLKFVFVTYVFAFFGMLLFMVLMFDVLTVRLHIHPRERLPKRHDDLDIFDLIRSRRSCRSFQARKLMSEDHNELMNCVRMNSGLPDIKQIGNSSIRFEYVSAPLTVWPVVGANEFLVAIAPKEYNRLAIIDIGRSLQRIVINATRMGLATCWIGPGADQSSIIQHLGDRFNPKEDHIICVCAIGYKSWYKPVVLRLSQIVMHRRLPLTQLFFSDSLFKKPLDVDKDPFKRFGRSYEVCQWSPSSFNEQPTRCVAVMLPKNMQRGTSEGDEQYLVRFDFYATTESRYYAAVALGIWCANWEASCQALGIPGHFAVLDIAEIGIQPQKQLPRYDVSWVLDEAISAKSLTSL